MTWKLIALLSIGASVANTVLLIKLLGETRKLMNDENATDAVIDRIEQSLGHLNDAVSNETTTVSAAVNALREEISHLNSGSSADVARLNAVADQLDGVVTNVNNIFSDATNQVAASGSITTPPSTSATPATPAEADPTSSTGGVDVTPSPVAEATPEAPAESVDTSSSDSSTEQSAPVDETIIEPSVEEVSDTQQTPGNLPTQGQPETSTVDTSATSSTDQSTEQSSSQSSSVEQDPTAQQSQTVDGLLNDTQSISSSDVGTLSDAGVADASQNSTTSTDFNSER